MQSSDAAGTSSAFCLRAEGLLETSPACLACREPAESTGLWSQERLNADWTHKTCGCSGSGCWHLPEHRGSTQSKGNFSVCWYLRKNREQECFIICVYMGVSRSLHPACQNRAVSQACVTFCHSKINFQSLCQNLSPPFSPSLLSPFRPI